MSAELNYFFKVELTLARYEFETKVTKTYKLVNKVPRDAADAADHWPLLRSVGEVSQNAGEVLPTINLSAIEVDDSIGGFGAGRKFSDLLQPGRWSAVEQPIAVYVSQARNDWDDYGAWDFCASGVVSDWEKASADDGDTLTLSVKPAKMDEKILTLEVNRSVAGMEAAPDSSLGKMVPLIVGGDQIVIPVRISADGASTVQYAYGTCLYHHLMTAALSKTLYSKKSTGEWDQITGSTVDFTTKAGSYTLNTYDARAWVVIRAGNPLVTGVQIYAQANGSSGRVSTAILDVFLLTVDANSTVVDDPLAQASIPLSRYDALNNNTANTFFPINVSFDKPAFLSEYSYYIGFRVRNYAVNDLSLCYDSSSGAELRQDDSDSATSGGAWSKTASNTLCHKLLRPTVSTTDHVESFTQGGLTYSMMWLLQFTPDAGQENCNFDNFPIAFGPGYGLCDFDDLVNHGTLTLIDSPAALADLLSYEWDEGSSAWVPTNTWDSSTLATSHYSTLYDGGHFRSRRVRGVFDRKVTASQVVQEIARGSASRVGVLPNGKSFMYPWGVTQSVAFAIPAEDVLALSWQQRDVSTILNRTVVNLGRNYLGSSRDFENAEDSNASYLFATDFSAANNATVAAMTKESRALYGNKDLAQTDFPIYPYMNIVGGGVEPLGAPGSILAEFYLSRYPKPLVYCSFVVPWHRYRGVKMFDVVTFCSPAFPAFFGTDPEPRQAWVVDAGGGSVVEVDVNSSYDMVRAQTYRGLVEGVSFVLAMERAPAIRLTVLVLQDQGLDPT